MKPTQEPDKQGVKGLVSIIIPTCDRGKSLRQSLISVFNQSYKQYEIIVIANSYQDKKETRDIVQTLSEAFKHPIIYFEFDEALGGAKARNIGIDKANGEYIAFLDDDDVWYPDKLQMQIKKLDTGKYAIVGTHHTCSYGDDKRYGTENSTLKTVRTHQDMQYENILGGFSLCMSKKSYIGNSRINKNLSALQDWDLWLKILNNTQLPFFVSATAYACVCRSGKRISSNIKQVLAGQKQLLDLWQHSLDKKAIDYHKMRSMCLTLRIMQKKIKYWHYFCSLPVIIRTIYHSPSRYERFRYKIYLALPIFNLDLYHHKNTSMRQSLSKKKIQAYGLWLQLKYRIYGIFKQKSGLNTGVRKTPLIISLTSYPPRFNHVFLTIESLLNQTCKPDKIILWLAKQEVSAHPLPKNLTRLVDRGLEIRVVDENIKSYKKLLYAITEFKHAHIITCDDDVIYKSCFVQGLYQSHQQHPDCIVAYRCRTIVKVGSQQLCSYNKWLSTTNNEPSYMVFAVGLGGIFYPVNSLHKRINDTIFKQLCPSSDDVWFKAMSLLNQTKTVKAKPIKFNVPNIYIKSPSKDTLWRINKQRNNIQIKQTFEHFNLYKYL